VTSASGKTQFALQVSLLVQLPIDKGGLSGSACYLTTNGTLPTSRLLEMAQEWQELVTPDTCNLENVHTRSTTSIPELRHILSHAIPSLIQNLSSTSSSHPLHLLVLDSISALFRTNTKTTSKTLFERSRELIDVALMLHHLASTYHLVVLVINEVNSVFKRVDSPSPNSPGGDQVLYSEQSRWFSRGDSLPSEGYREAGLGLVWASQVGLRVLMTRTGRRKHLLYSRDGKRPRNRTVDNEEGKDSEAVLIRRISVISSSFSPPDSADFIILRSGITTVSDDV
jgi:Rad51